MKEDFCPGCKIPLINNHCPKCGLFVPQMTQEQMNECIEAIKKYQQPMKPLTVENFLHWCPICLKRLYSKTDCPHCGQKIKWKK